MFKSLSCLKRWIVITFCCLVTPLASSANDTLALSKATTEGRKLALTPYLLAWEDTLANGTPGIALHHKELFAPLHVLRMKSATSIYWLRLTIKAEAGINPATVLSFSNLTFVDAYLYKKDSCIAHRKSGAFVPRSLLQNQDSRFHITLPIAENGTYTLLLKVHHTKRYMPLFDFSLEPKDIFIKRNHKHELLDAWFQGAVAVFFLYTLLSWLVTRFRPYLWLLLFIGGVGFYGICSGPYFIDWFFPEHPATGWLFNGPFLHIGLFGFCLLIIDFWELPKYNPILYRFARFYIAVLVLISVGGTCINYFTGNFYLTNSINVWSFILPFSLVVALLVCCFRRLSRAQKYLYYGIAIFLVAGLFITLSSAIIHEQALLVAPYVSNFTTLVVFLLFATGLKEALRQHEIDKFAVLKQLTDLQKQQNILLEKKVEERTEELVQFNQQLQSQSSMLAQRNATIETLINELSHRVKNNLQLLYSLGSLQLTNVTDKTSNHILKGNMARIKAMMLVNQKLNYADNVDQLNLAGLTAELTRHLQDIYDRSRNIKLSLEIPNAIELPSKQTLSLGLIFTELLTNSFKYAFVNTTNPLISIKINYNGDHLKIVYADNGVGIKDSTIDTSSSMGLSLIHDLSRQLNGSVTTVQQDGLVYTFHIPIPN